MQQENEQNDCSICSKQPAVSRSLCIPYSTVAAIALLSRAASCATFQSLSRCINIRSNQRMSIPKPLRQVVWQVSCQELSVLNPKPVVATSFKLPLSTGFGEMSCCQNEMQELAKFALPLRPLESWGILPLLYLSFDQGMHLLQHLHLASP